MPALTAAEIESAAPNAWTGKPSALVYESEGDVSAWLVKRGLTAYSARPEDDKAADLVVVTETVEAEIATRIKGVPVTPGRLGERQGLLFPAAGAYDSSGELVPSDSAPLGLLEGIRLLAEEKAAGRFLKGQRSPGIKRQKHREVMELEYFEGVDGSSIATLHPDAWRRIAKAFPRVDV